VSRRAFDTVAKSYPEVVERIFEFMVTQLGGSGPQRDGRILPTIAYVWAPLSYRISLNDLEMTVVAQVEIDLGETRLVADFGELVKSAGLSSINKVPRTARTLYNLEQTLSGQADLFRRLHPLLWDGSGLKSEAFDLFRSAGAREW
jgi:hypothetical protein